MLEEVIQFVNEAFESSAHKSNLKHFDRTIYWLLQLKPDADEPMKIAAYSHDVDRAFWTPEMTESMKNIEMDNPEYLKLHQASSARIISEFLVANDYDPKSIDRINNMIIHHEVGGDDESNFIKDADSLSFFEVNAMRFVDKMAKSYGKQKIKNKFDFMYNRISSEQAKALAKPMYDIALTVLESS